MSLLGILLLTGFARAEVPTEQIYVYLGDPKVLDLKFTPSKTKAPEISQGRIAGATVVRTKDRPAQLEILPKALGATDITLADETGAPKLTLSVRVGPAKRFHAFQKLVTSLVSEESELAAQQLDVDVVSGELLSFPLGYVPSMALVVGSPELLAALLIRRESSHSIGLLAAGVGSTSVLVRDESGVLRTKLYVHSDPNALPRYKWTTVPIDKEQRSRIKFVAPDSVARSNLYADLRVRKVLLDPIRLLVPADQSCSRAAGAASYYCRPEKGDEAQLDVAVHVIAAAPSPRPSHAPAGPAPLELSLRELQNPKALANSAGTPSQVKNVSLREIRGFACIDAHHFGSERAGYHTRYLDCVTEGLTVRLVYSFKGDEVDALRRQLALSEVVFRSLKGPKDPEE